jgi:hypothetical protein
MNHPPDEQPAVLHYATAPDAAGWPIGVYVGALLWAFITLRLFTWRLAKRPSDAELNYFGLRVQLAFLTLAAIRLAWAVIRKDRSRGWVLYVILLALATPLWLLLERIGYRLGE